MILHISNDYSGSKVYKQLVRAIDGLSLSQTIYTPVRSSDQINKNLVPLTVEKSHIIYSNILNSFSDRIFYKSKIRKIFADITSKVHLDDISVIHAHTWYSDGGVAYLLYKKYKIPYVITVRSSDIAFFHRFLLWERSFGRQILESAKKIIFVSKSYHNNFQKITQGVYESKINIIPNGVDPFWLDNVREKKYVDLPFKSNQRFSILYVGQFIKRKNVDKLIDAVALLRHKYRIPAYLNLVGEVVKKKSYIKKIESHDFIRSYGKIVDKNVLLSIYRENNIFAMPSVRETFGLVYIEALSQGLPILYTEKDGIDGFYDSAGEGVSKPITVNQIALKIKKMFDNFNAYSISEALLVDNHDWNLIAEKLKYIYLNEVR